MERPPDRLVTSGPYALTRNPMYLGHLIFTLGLALTFRSPLGVVLMVERARRFSRRVRIDEERLERIFADEYRAYRHRVKRWVPGLIFLTGGRPG
jgi:protein-S-isoprenylcysteine O-methyltransferase Ste14